MIYFLSDAHIGSRALDDWHAHEKKVCDLLMSFKADATKIFLLGDIFDFWYEYLWRKPQEYSRTLSTLKELTDSGIEVHFFVGNHDLWTFGWLAKQTGIIVHKEVKVMTIAGKQCLLAHGDGLVPSYYSKTFSKKSRRRIRQFKFLRWIFHNRLLQGLFSLVPPSLGDKFGYEWARRSRNNEKKKKYSYLGENKESLVLYAKEKETTRHLDYYIFGHRHIELDLMLATGARVVILGDMYRQFTYAAMNESGNLQLLNIE